MGKYAKGCISKRHRYHTFIPWYWHEPYDKFCDICGKKAAWFSGAGISLCDCHAEDWSRYTNTEDRRIHEARNLKKIWGIVYAEFRNKVLSGDYCPNDFELSSPPSRKG